MTYAHEAANLLANCGRMYTSNFYFQKIFENPFDFEFNTVIKIRCELNFFFPVSVIIMARNLYYDIFTRLYSGPTRNVI